MVRRKCPYESDLICLLWPNPFKMNWFNEIWMNWVKWSEMSDLKELTLWTLWESPYGRVKVNPMRVTWVNLMGKSLSKWSESMRFEWIEVNRTIWDKMSEMIDLTWNNPMGISLWSIESVPMRVTWVNPMRISLSKWMELMRFEWIEVNRTIRGEMSDLKDLMRSTLWESPYGRVKVSLWEWLEWIQWESPYELRMSVPINLTWLISVRKSLCSVEWMSLSKWLRTTLWEWSYGQLRVSL